MTGSYRIFICKMRLHLVICALLKTIVLITRHIVKLELLHNMGHSAKPIFKNCDQVNMY